ncbi:MAG: hypothetical protein ACM3O3_12470 [Syntrophothermus sp.]
MNLNDIFSIDSFKIEAVPVESTSSETIRLLNNALNKYLEKKNNELKKQELQNSCTCNDTCKKVTSIDDFNKTITLDRVFYNPPYTSLKWSNGEITTVKCMEDDVFDSTLGFIYAIIKHIYYNNNNEFKRDIKEYEKANQKKLNNHYKKELKNLTNLSSIYSIMFTKKVIEMVNFILEDDVKEIKKLIKAITKMDKETLQANYNDINDEVKNFKSKVISLFNENEFANESLRIDFIIECMEWDLITRVITVKSANVDEIFSLFNINESYMINENVSSNAELRDDSKVIRIDNNTEDK